MPLRRGAVAAQAVASAQQRHVVLLRVGPVAGERLLVDQAAFAPTAAHVIVDHMVRLVASTVEHAAMNMVAGPASKVSR